MDRATVSRIEGWDVRPVAGGYAGLADLADAEFTGAVAGGGAHLFMLNGRVVGVFDGTISAFEGAESTAYEAPDPALPLLFAMKERGGEVRGKYYTDDTPLREVDETLSEGGFTGFLELSENVLSGDYYAVYYGGRSLSAAFVGNEERVITGEEAFELAADEVGIYEVRAVELEVTDVPEPPEDADVGTAGAAGAVGAASTGADDEAAAAADGEPETAPEGERDHAVDAAEAADLEETDDGADAADAADEGEGEPEATPDDPSVGDAEPEETAVADATDDDESPAEATSGDDDDVAEAPTVDEAEADETTAGPGDRTGAPATESTSDAGSADRRPGETPGRTASAGSSRPSGAERRREVDETDERFREEERWREARTVPALDPEESELPAAKERLERTEPPAAETAEPDAAPAPADADEPEPAASSARVAELEAELQSTERERRRLAERAETLAEERDELAEERDELAERIEELEALIEDQEDRLEAQEAEIAAGAAASSASGGHERAGGEAIDPETALDQTDLFVRYRSKGQATLQSAHDGQAGIEEVAENLRLETHSRFDPAGVTVDGRPFEAYLSDTIEYRFVAWLIEEFLYEIRGTGTERSLRAVYDALPEIDRAEFGGTVTGVDEEGNERQETFDVVCRDRMGKPLVVANINDSLDPATGEMMGALVEDATAAAEAHESVGAAFLVTASFFQPDALETAADATGGGFLSRDSKKSFVKLSRKGGYHLCLAEARGGDFHVAVPEL